MKIANQWVQNKSTHLNTVGTMFNSKAWGIRCLENWPCKRMVCKRCVRIRRNYFVREAVRYSEYNGLDCHVVISWPLWDGEDPWSKIHYQLPNLTKAVSGRIGKYIRSIGIGGKEDTPHVHYLVSSEGFDFLKTKAKKIGPVETTVFPKGPIIVKDVFRLMGYFYDRNFLPAYLDPARPRRIRILSGSRGMSYGFPRHNLANVRGH